MDIWNTVNSGKRVSLKISCFMITRSSNSIERGDSWIVLEGHCYDKAVLRNGNGI
jgi:hypothetical protein